MFICFLLFFLLLHYHKKIPKVLTSPKKNSWRQDLCQSIIIDPRGPHILQHLEIIVNVFSSNVLINTQKQDWRTKLSEALKSFKHNLFVNSATIWCNQGLRNIEVLENLNPPSHGKKSLQILGPLTCLLDLCPQIIWQFGEVWNTLTISF